MDLYNLHNNLNQKNYVLLVIGLLYLIILFTRLLPFGMKYFFEKSVLLKKIGVLLPGTIMLILLLHTLDDVIWLKTPYGIPELLVIGNTLCLYYWRRSILLALVPNICIYIIYFN